MSKISLTAQVGQGIVLHVHEHKLVVIFPQFPTEIMGAEGETCTRPSGTLLPMMVLTLRALIHTKEV